MTTLICCASCLVGATLLLSMEKQEGLYHTVGTNVLSQRDARQRVGPTTVDISSDGRFVAVESLAQLLPVDTNSVADIYVLDRVSNQLTLDSIAVDGGSADGTSTRPRLSGDGRYVVFESVASNVATELRG